MKNYLFLILLLSFKSSVFSQSNFTFKFQTKNDEFPMDIISLPGGGIIASIRFRETYYDHYQQKLIKIDNTGNIVNEINLGDTLKDCALRNLIRKNDTIYSIGDINDGLSTVWMVMIDTNLNVMADKKFQTEANEVVFMKSFISSDNTINSALTCNLVGGYIQFLKFNLSGDTLHSRIRNVNGYAAVFDFFQHNEYYRLLGRWTLGQSMELVLLDSTFNTISVSAIPMGADNSLTGKALSSETYLLGGCIRTTNTDWDYTIERLDFSSELLNYNIIGIGNDSLDFPAADNCLDFIEENRIFVSNMILLGSCGAYCNGYNHFYISLFDSVMNKLWTRSYGGDKYYYLTHIYATDDGGAIIATSMYDYLLPDSRLDVLIMKVNSEGLITGNNDTEKPTLQQSIFPNPGNNYIITKLPAKYREATFKLYNNNGLLVMTSLIENETPLKTSHLPKGFYIWYLEAEGIIIDSGKWIKN